MSAPKHSSPATKEALHRILKSAFTAKDVADLLPSVDAQTPISQARQLLQELGCPILGVKEHGLYVGWLDAQDTERSGTCRVILRPFNERPMLHESAPFRDVVLALAQNSPVFVTVMGETAAAICPCDLQDAPMRMWLFGLITLMETLMQRALSGQLPEGQWQAYISPGRLRRAQELYAERLRRHEEITLDDCLQFSDKADILLRYPATSNALGFPSRRAGQDFFSKLEMLRNCLAHSQPLPQDSLPTIVALAISLDILLEVEATPFLGRAAGPTPLQAVKSLADRLQEQNIDLSGRHNLPGTVTPPPTPRGKLPPKTVKGKPVAPPAPSP